MSNKKPLLLATGILITATHPKFGDCVFLRRRGSFNPETATIPTKYGEQKFPGGYQPPAHGKNEEGEPDTTEGREAALLREVHEELGGDWAAHIGSCLKSRSAIVVHKYIEGGQSVWVYHVHVEWSFTKNFPQDCIEFVPLPGVETIKKLEDFGPAGVPDRDTVAMFNGQRYAVVNLAKSLGYLK